MRLLMRMQRLKLKAPFVITYVASKFCYEVF